MQRTENSYKCDVLVIGGGPAGSTEILSVKMINTVFYESDYSKAAAYGVIIVGVLLAYTIMYLKLTSTKEVKF